MGAINSEIKSPDDPFKKLPLVFKLDNRALVKIGKNEIDYQVKRLIQSAEDRGLVWKIYYDHATMSQIIQFDQPEA